MHFIRVVNKNNWVESLGREKYWTELLEKIVAWSPRNGKMNSHTSINKYLHIYIYIYFSNLLLVGQVQKYHPAFLDLKDRQVRAYRTNPVQVRPLLSYMIRDSPIENEASKWSHWEFKASVTPTCIRGINLFSAFSMY